MMCRSSHPHQHLPCVEFVSEHPEYVAPNNAMKFVSDDDKRIGIRVRPATLANPLMLDLHLSTQRQPLPRCTAMYPCEAMSYSDLSLTYNDYKTMQSGSRATEIFL
jgi:hypothetical protein